MKKSLIHRIGCQKIMLDMEEIKALKKTNNELQSKLTAELIRFRCMADRCVRYETIEKRYELLKEKYLDLLFEKKA